MPDTGFMSPDNVAANANTFFSTLWITEGGGIIVFAGTSGTQTVDGFENDGTLPAGATVVGAEVLLINTYLSSGTATFDIKLSIDGGSNFSSAITSGTIDTDSSADYTLGGSSQLWGLDWSSFSDLSNLQVKGLNGTSNIFADHVQIKLHYTEAVDEITRVILSNNLTIHGGYLKII